MAALRPLQPVLGAAPERVNNGRMAASLVRREQGRLPGYSELNLCTS